jgi:DHA1 family multidrug resistance protein-like MFS transporter
MTQSSGANRRGLIILLFFTFFMVVGFEMIMPLIIGHYVYTLGFSATSVAFALTVRYLSQQGLSVFGGALADRFDVRAIISIGVLLRALGFMSLAFATNFPFLMVAMILTGFGGMLFEVPYQTAIANLTTEENRSRYYSLNNTIIGIASTIGPLLGVVLLRLDFGAVCFGAAFCFMANFIISRFAMPPIVRSRPSYSVAYSFKAVAKDRPFLLFAFLMIVFWLAASQINISFPLKVQEISGSADGVGMMWAVYAAVTAVLQYPLVSLMLRKYSPRQIVVMGISLITGSLLLVSFVSTTYAFLAVVVVFSLGMLLARPNQQAIAVAMADSQAMGLYLGVNALGLALGSGLGTMIGGVFFDLAQKTALSTLPWFLFGAIAMVAMLGFMLNKEIGQPRIATNAVE